MHTLEKLEIRLNAIDAAITEVMVAIAIEQTLSDSVRPDAQLVAALDSLSAVHAQISNLKIAMAESERATLH